MGTLMADIRAALADPAAVQGARDALVMLRGWVGVVAHIPGCDTGARLALRIHSGMTVEQAAAREYAYRWHLPLNQWVNHAESRSRSRPVTGAWSVPHPIGM